MATVSKWFDYNYYMSSKLAQVQKTDATMTMSKLVAGFEAAGFAGAEGAEKHFLTNGQYEELAPNAFFNAVEYYRAKAADAYNKDPKTVTDLDVANVKLALDKAGMSAWSHYKMFGTEEGVNPSNSFNSDAYMQAKVDALNSIKDGKQYTVAELKAEFQKMGLSALEHFLTYGGADGEPAGLTADGKIPAAFAVPESQKVNGGGSSEGQTFILTDKIDTIVGTAGNDIILGDFTSTSTLNAGDQINGGDGIDTLKMYGTYNSANMPVAIKSVEVLELAVAANANLDFSAYTKAANGVEKIVIDDAALMSGNSITTGAGQSLSLATGTANKATAGAVTWVTAAADATLDLVLNGYQGKAATAQGLTITDAQATTTHIDSIGAANKVTTLTLGAATNKVVVTGDQALTVTTNLVSTGGATTLKTVDASATTGGVDITFAAATNAAFAFTGGSGNDTIKFADNGLAALTSGSQLDGGAGTADKIGILDTVISAAEYAALNAAKNFEVLGLNAAVTVDASQLSSFKEFSLDTNAAQVINGMHADSVVTVTASHAAAVTLAGGIGASSVKVVIGNDASKGLTVGTQSSALVTIGQNSVALVSNGDKTAANTIGELKVADNSTYIITGDNDLTITDITGATSTGSKYDASNFNGKLTITANDAALDISKSLGDVIIGGNAGDTITTGVNGCTLTGNGGNDKFVVKATVYDSSVAGSPVTKITDFTKGDMIEFTDATAQQKVDLSAVVAGKSDADIYTLLVGATGVADGEVVWGNYNGFTYVFNETDGSAGAAGGTDLFVKLTGTLDLSNSTFAANVMTFA